MSMMKRILAMLLAIIMLMGGALAEDEILMIVQDVVEESVQEEIPAEEAEPEEVLFEDIFAVEEILPETETFKEAEGELQIAALLLSDGEETEDEICLHEFADSWEEKNNIVYDEKAVTPTAHIYTCDIVNAFYCGDCDSEWESEVVQSGVQVIEEHAWSIDWNDENAQEGPDAQYHCMDCGYVSVCEHEFELVDKDLCREECVDNGDGTHSYIEYFDCRYCCEKCGVEYWQKDEASVTRRTQSHNIFAWLWEDAQGNLEKNIRCEDCDVQIEDTCEHDFVVVKSDYNSESCIDNGDGTHTGVAYITYEYECSKCGAGMGSEVHHDEKTVTNEPHVWKGECYGGNDVRIYCAACGSTKLVCDHDFVEGEAIREDVHRLHDNDDGTHNLQVWCRVKVTCSKCGVFYWSPEEDNLIFVDNEKHEMDANGRCIWCFGNSVCSHTYQNCVCTACGDVKHSYVDCVCTACGDIHHTGLGLMDCVCDACGQTLHELVEGMCSRCGYKLPEAGITANVPAEGVKLGVKMKHALDVAVYPEDASVSYKSSNKKAATVNAEGVITGVAKGKATITISAKSEGVEIAPVKVVVNVTAAPTSVSLPKADKGGKLLYVGESLQLQETVKPAGALYTAEWSSGNEAVAAVENGLVTGVAPGTAKITVKTQNGKKASYSVKVVPVPTGIRVEDAILLGEGQTHTLKASLLPEGAEGGLDYKAEGDAITVTKDGRITAAKVGSAQVIVSAYGLPDQIVNVAVVQAPEMVFFARQSVAASLKEKTMQLNPLLPDGTAAGFTWSSGNKKIATVDASGLITFKKAGTVTITVKTHNKKSAKCKINIMPKAPTSFTAEPGNPDLLVGESTDLKLKFKKKEGSSEPKMRFVSGEGVVSCLDGVITALKPGSATLEFEAYNGVKAQCTVNVYPELKDIKIISDCSEASVGQKIQLDVKRTDAEGNEIHAGSYTWRVDNERLAAINQKGLLTIKGPGIVMVTAEAYNGEKDTRYFGTMPAPEKVQLSEKKVTLGVGDGFVLEGTADMPATITVKSSNAKVAQVELMQETDNSVRYSVYAAGKTGTATITFKTHNGKTAKCTVTVKAKPKTLKLNHETLELALGETATLKTSVTPKNAANVVSWKSSNDRVVTVQNGVLTAVGVGAAVITAGTYNGLTAECTVQVWPAVAKVEVYGAKYMSLGQKQTLTVKTYDAQGRETIGAFTIKPSAKLSVKGMVAQAKKVGANQTLTVTAYNGVSATLDVTIVKVPAKVTVAEKNVKLIVGEKHKPVLSAPVKDAPADYVYSGYGFTTSKKNVAAIEWDAEMGGYVIVAKGKGTATITAKTHNGKKATIKVTVVESLPVA